VQNRVVTGPVGGQGEAGRPKLQVEREPFLASKAVIFDVNPTGPHILVVMFWLVILLPGYNDRSSALGQNPPYTQISGLGLALKVHECGKDSRI
jgi:hypothetical protein